MPRFIVKLDQYYMEWSTIVDAPVTWGMTIDEFREYYRAEYGIAGMRDLDKRMARVEKNGTSAFDAMSAEDLISGNRAGPKETELAVHEVFQAYCLRESVRGWLPT